ncbi:hypothetical protein GCM10027074_72330 [Streptomyces deserti]
MHRRTLLTGIAGGLVAAGTQPAFASARRHVLHVRPGGSVQAAVDAVDGPGRTIVVHPGTYREVIEIPAEKAEVTLRGATGDPRDVVSVLRHPRAGPSLAVAAYGGEHFRDTGSWFNGRPARLDAVAGGLGLTDEVGWDPADVYDYRVLRSPSAVERYVLRHAGAGRPYDHQ